MSYLNGLDYPDWKKLSLLGLVAEQPGSSGIIRWGVKHRRYTKYGDVWASGSGSDALFSYLDKSDVDGLIYDFPMLVVGAQALTSEFFTTPGLQDGYGGGYEFAYPSSGRIQKFDNLVYVIWFLGNKKQLLKTSANGGVFHATPILIQNFYVDDILISLRSKLIRNTIRGKLLKIGRGDFNIMVAPPPFVGRDAGSGKLNHDTVNMVSIVISAFVVETGGKLPDYLDS